MAAVLVTTLAGCTGSPTASRRTAASIDATQSPPRYSLTGTPTLSASPSTVVPRSPSAEQVPTSASSAAAPSRPSGGPPTSGAPPASSAPAAPSSRVGAAPGVPTRSHGPGAGAAGAPIRIPARVQDQGRPLAEVTSEIEAGVRDQCGGTLCLALRHEERVIEGFSSCDFFATEPAQRTTVPRGSTVVIVAGSGPCGGTEPTESGPTP